MSTNTLFVTALVITLGAVQYGTAFFALRDLSQRSRVRGNNKVLWGIFILCVPIVGAVYYSWSGPMGFRLRPSISSPIKVNPTLDEEDDASAARRNITPITQRQKPVRLTHVVGETAVRLEPRHGTRSLISTTRYHKTGS